MPLTSPDRPGPRELSSQTSGAARTHDVVVAATKVMHNTPLDARDKSSLKWADQLLSSVLEAEAVVVVPSADELVPGDETLSLLRKVAADLDSSMRAVLGAVREANRAALSGARDERTAAAAETLRQLFSNMSRASLRSQVDAHTTELRSGSWQRLTTSSIS